MMERLIDTQLKNIEKVYESMPMGGKVEFSKSAVESLHQVLAKLKEYQDTGLEPSQIAEIDRLYQAKCEEVAEYKKKLADGRMVELPCKVGDTVYIIDHYNKKIKEANITEIHYNGKSFEYSYAATDSEGGFFDVNIGDSVYLYREQAEQALKESGDK
jgi:hypothetical protein